MTDYELLFDPGILMDYQSVWYINGFPAHTIVIDSSSNDWSMDNHYIVLKNWDVESQISGV